MWCVFLCNPSTWEAKAGEASPLYRMSSPSSQGYIVRNKTENPKQTTINKKEKPGIAAGVLACQPSVGAQRWASLGAH